MRENISACVVSDFVDLCLENFFSVVPSSSPPLVFSVWGWSERSCVYSAIKCSGFFSL